MMNQISIPVIDVRKSIGFYERLGLKLIARHLPEYAQFLCPDGVSTFSLHRVDRAPKDGVWIYFEQENLDEYIASLLDKGFVFEELPTDKPWLWRESILNDLDNNKIVIYFGGNTKTLSPWSIN
jgi:catechol 2,3-dioxygenase-like lactoylglutathione lyase family enzyme